MNCRLTGSVLSLLALAVVAGCGAPCGPSNCEGCCDASGLCQLSANDHCGALGAQCRTCTSFQACRVGVCGGLEGAGSGSPTGAGAASTTVAAAASSSS